MDPIQSPAAESLIDEWSRLCPTDCVTVDALVRFVCPGRPVWAYREALQVYQAAQHHDAPRWPGLPEAKSFRKGGGETESEPDAARAGTATAVGDRAAPLLSDEQILDHRLELVYAAAARGYLVDGRASSARMTEARFLSAAHALGCAEADLAHLWALFGECNERFLLSGHRPIRGGETDWFEPKADFASAPRSRRLSRRELLQHICGLIDVAACVEANNGFGWVLMVDLDCHGLSLTLPTGEVVPLDRSSIRRRIDACACAFEQPPSLAVSSRRGVHAFWFIADGVVQLEQLRAFAERRLAAVGTVARQGWIEVKSMMRVPLGLGCPVLQPESLEPMFPLSWDCKGRELAELRRSLPISSQESFDRGLLRGGISIALVDSTLAGLTGRQFAPATGGARIQPVAGGVVRLAVSDIEEARRIIDQGLAGEHQLNAAMLVLTRYVDVCEGLEGEAAVERVTEILTAHPANFEYSEGLRRSQAAVMKKARLMERHWREVWRPKWRAKGMRSTDPALNRQMLLANLAQGVNADELEDILALGLTRETTGRTVADLTAQQFLAFMIAMARRYGSHWRDGDRDVGWRARVAWVLRRMLFGERQLTRIAGVAGSLTTAVHLQTGKRLLSRVEPAGCRSLAREYLIGVPPGKGDKAFLCLEAGLLETLGESEVRRQYSSRDAAHIIRKASHAVTVGEVTWIEALLGAVRGRVTGSSADSTEDRCCSGMQDSQSNEGAGAGTSLFIASSEKRGTDNQGGANRFLVRGGIDKMRDAAELEGAALLANGPHPFLCSLPAAQVPEECGIEKAMPGFRKQRNDDLLYARLFDGENHPWTIEEYIDRRLTQSDAEKAFCLRCRHADHSRLVRHLWHTQPDSAAAFAELDRWLATFHSDVPAEGMPIRKRRVTRGTDLER